MASPGVMVSSLTFALTAASLPLVILELSQKLQHHQCLNSSMRIMLPWSDTPLQVRSKTSKSLPLQNTCASEYSLCIYVSTLRLINSNTLSLSESTDLQETVLSTYNVIKIFTSKKIKFRSLVNHNLEVIGYLVTLYNISCKSFISD